MVSEFNEDGKKFESALVTAVKLPGVKVDRKTFLKDIFISKIDDQERFNILLAEGPIAAKVSQKELDKIATSLINKRTNQSTGMSFVSGLPGGIAMAATIPGDVLQFFGMALRLSQELAYLYGCEDLWDDNAVSDEKVMNQLTLYLGVMFGVSGSTTALKIVSSGLSKRVLKTLPQKALTKTVYYPIIKKVAQVIGVKMTKDTLAKGVSKVIPVIGGVISGGLTYASMKPMGKRLKETLEQAQFNYSEDEIYSDIKMASKDIIDVESMENIEDVEIIEDVNDIKVEDVENKVPEKNIIDEILKYKELLDQHIITQEEFIALKSKLIKEA